MSNLQPNCCFKFDFQKVDQHAGGKWLIHNTKRRKDNQLQSLKLPCTILILHYSTDICISCSFLKILENETITENICNVCHSNRESYLYRVI